MTQRGSLLLEMVIALGIFAACSITISGVLVQTSGSITSARARVEATDLASSAFTLIQIGTLTPEAAERLSAEEVRSLLGAETTPDQQSEPLYELVVETEPTNWRSLTTVRVEVVRPGSDRALGEASGVVNLSRVRSARSERAAP